MRNLKQIEKSLLSYYMVAMEYRGPVDLLKLQFASAEPSRAATVQVARIVLSCSDRTELFFCGTLSIDHAAIHVRDEHHFIGIFDSAETSLLELVAAALHFDRFVERLDYGHSFPLGPHSTLRQRGYRGALVLEKGLYSFFDECTARLPPQTSVFAVLPITETDLELKRREGLDALLAAWDAEKRDPLRIYGL